MRTKSRKHRVTLRAFTLLEVLMVVVIIGLLAAFVVPNLFSSQDEVKENLTRATVKTGFAGALDQYRLRMDEYPNSDDGGLQLLIEAPDDEELAKKWREPFLKNPEDIFDAWGNEYVYTCPGKYNEGSYDLSSMGPDEEEGTDDDIKNWKDT